MLKGIKKVGENKSCKRELKWFGRMKDVQDDN